VALKGIRHPQNRVRLDSCKEDRSLAARDRSDTREEVLEAPHSSEVADPTTIINKPLKEKLPANTEKLRTETDNQREAAPTRGK
jgi:hypothetical protein